MLGRHQDSGSTPEQGRRRSFLLVPAVIAGSVILTAAMVLVALDHFSIISIFPAGVPVASDKTPPYVTGISPQPNAAKVKPDTELVLHIKDDGAGVDKDSILFKVQGTAIKPELSGDGADLRLIYKPASPFKYGETVNIQIQADDLARTPNNVEYSFSFSVCDNIAPAFLAIPDKTAYQFETVQFSVNARDSYDDVLTYSVTGLPSGARFDNATRTFTWIPEQVGRFDINFTVSDSCLEDRKTVVVTVNPMRPVDIGLVYYGKHAPAEDEQILKLKPRFIIGNPAHSLWGEAYGYDTWWLLQNVSRFQGAGIKVIGYLTAGYEGKGSSSGIEGKWFTLEMNKKLIKNMAELDRVDGVFIDECSAFPGAEAKQYLKELTDLARSYKLITWGNTGQGNFDSWYFSEGGFDFMHSGEDWHGQAITTLQRQWGSRMSVTGFKSSYSVEDAVRLTLDAWKKGLAFPYINSSGYSTLPGWLEEYGRRLRGSILD